MAERASWTDRKPASAASPASRPASAETAAAVRRRSRRSAHRTSLARTSAALVRSTSSPSASASSTRASSPATNASSWSSRASMAATRRRPVGERPHAGHTPQQGVGHCGLGGHPVERHRGRARHGRRVDRGIQRSEQLLGAGRGTRARPGQDGDDPAHGRRG